MGREWSEEEVGILYDKWPDHTSEQISDEYLDRTPQAVREKAYREGIKTEEHSQPQQLKEKPEGVDIGDGVRWEELDYSTRHYYRNKGEGIVEKKNDRRDRRQMSLRKWYNNIKEENGCCVCGENSPPALVFHHIDDGEKEHNVSEMISNGLSVESIADEMEKCSVLCANCHRKIHAGVLEPEGLSGATINIEYELVE